MEDYIPILNKTVQSTVHEVIKNKIINQKRIKLFCCLKESNGSVHMARWNNKKYSRRFS